jgi:sugar phosphate isomerase/epimerase
MLSKTDSKIGDENIAAAAELGFDYMELPLAQVMDLSDAAFKTLLERIKSGGLPLETCNNFFPASLRLTGENADIPAALAYCERALARAGQMGAQIIVLGSSGAKNIPAGFPYEQAKGQFLSLLRALENLVAPLGITVVLEPLNSKESNFILNVAEGLDMVREAACDHIKLLADYYHMRMENEDYTALYAAGDALRHVHLAAKDGRVYPKDGDGEDYAGFFSALKKAGYNGRVSLEAYAMDMPADAKAAIALLRPLMG